MKETHQHAYLLPRAVQLFKTSPKALLQIPSHLQKQVLKKGEPQRDGTASGHLTGREAPEASAAFAPKAEALGRGYLSWRGSCS